MRLTLLRNIRFSCDVKELRIHLCQKSDASKGVRDFIMNKYPQMKKDNPDLPILVRECEFIQPKLWVRYAKGKETSVPLANKTADDVRETIETAARVLN